MQYHLLLLRTEFQAASANMSLTPGQPTPGLCSRPDYLTSLWQVRSVCTIIRHAFLLKQYFIMRFSQFQLALAGPCLCTGPPSAVIICGRCGFCRHSVKTQRYLKNLLSMYSRSNIEARIVRRYLDRQSKAAQFQL